MSPTDHSVEGREHFEVRTGVVPPEKVERGLQEKHVFVDQFSHARLVPRLEALEQRQQLELVVLVEDREAGEATSRAA